MALFNYANREITAKVVYYGPGVCGKTTSLQYIHERIAPVQRGKLLSLATETDRTIFFDLLPLKLGEIRGFKLRFQLYTVPGQVKYNKTRKLVLQGADAVVFVADSQLSRREANIESYRNLQENLEEQGKNIDNIPLVYSFNKRDLENVLPPEELNRDLNPKKLPYFPTVATKGVGVMETLEAISKLALQDIEERLLTKAAHGEPGETEIPEDFSLTGADTVEMQGESALTFSTEELEDLTLKSDFDLGGEQDQKFLETRPIGYDTALPIQEVEIREEEVAHTGTLKESEFFDLKDIEEQALRELDSFIEEQPGEEEFLFDLAEDSGHADVEPAPQKSLRREETPEETFEFSLLDTPDAAKSSRFDGDDLGFSFSAGGEEGFPDEEAAEEIETESEALLPASEQALSELETLDFGMEDSAPTTAEETEFTFSLDEEPVVSGSEKLEFNLEEEPPEFNLSGPSSGEKEEMLAFTLDEDSAETLFAEDLQESTTKAEIESLDLSDSDLALALGEEELEGAEADLRGEPTFLTTDEEEFLEFGLDEATEQVVSDESPGEIAAKAEIAALDLSDSDLELAFGEEEPGEQPSFGEFEASEEPPDFRITDSVRFEMQHSEEISSVTPFEKELDELSEEMFTAAEEESDSEEFQSEPSEETEPEPPFQPISDDTIRLVILAKHFYQQAETLRAKHTVHDNILTIMLYYAAVETILKSAAVKYETCDPNVASFKIMLESIEEETDKFITGKKPLIDNIVDVKNTMQLKTEYPDDEACELAARICERFLTTFAQEFLAVDFTEVSPVLAKPTNA